MRLSICMAHTLDNRYCDYEQRERVCAGIGYMDRKFFCLFDTGDVMIFGVGGGSRGGGERTMLLATPQLLPGQLATRDSLRVVLWSKSTRREESLVVRWVRRGGDRHHGGGRGSSSFRLVGVESKAFAAAAAVIEEMEEETSGGAVLARQKSRWILSNDLSVGVLIWLILLGIYLFVLATWPAWLPDLLAAVGRFSR